VPERFILLPPSGVRGRHDEASTLGDVPLARSTEQRVHTLLAYEPSQRPVFGAYESSLPSESVPVAVIDAVHEDGPKLVELSAEAALTLRRAGMPARLEPLREYHPTGVSPALPVAPPPAAAGAPALTVEVRCATTGGAIADAPVTTIVDPTLNLGDHGVTDGSGAVSLRLGPSPVQVAELRVDRPLRGWWGAWRQNLSISSPYVVDLEPLDLSFAAFDDGLRHFYGSVPQGGDGKGVRVGVIDTGIDLQHADLHVHDGRNTVTGEPSDRFEDNGVGHGTHVAGIIAARGGAPNGIEGLAPEVELWSFRVYGANTQTATNYAIVKALIYAADEGCHVVNLSLGGIAPDQAVKDAIDDARSHGTVVIAAAGNDFRKPVGVPGCYATAVTALGRSGTFPAGAREAGDVASPRGSDPDDFLAGFSNVGQDVDFTAPGVGIVSTVPGGHAPDRGTSMAAAAVTGMAARLVSAQPALLAMPADGARSAAVLNLLGSSATTKGFGFSGEGFGML
jgi:subtilisin